MDAQQIAMRDALLGHNVRMIREILEKDPGAHTFTFDEDLFDNGNFYDIFYQPLAMVCGGKGIRDDSERYSSKNLRKIFHMLLDAGAQPSPTIYRNSATDDTNQISTQPLYCCLDQYQNPWMKLKDREYMANALIHAGADPSIEGCEDWGENALDAAVMLVQYENIAMKMLNECAPEAISKCINRRSPSLDMMRPLEAAIGAYCSLHLVRALVASGADPELPVKDPIVGGNILPSCRHLVVHVGCLCDDLHHIVGLQSILDFLNKRKRRKLTRARWAFLHGVARIMAVHRRAVVTANHPKKKQKRGEFEV